MEEKTDRAIGILKSWMHPKRQSEATEQTIALLNDLSDIDVFKALEGLQQSKKYIRGMKGNQLDLSVKIQTLDDGRIFPVRALLDSGSTGSCINRRFVEANKIQTRKTALPVPVYNADGTHNRNGAITDYVTLRVTIQDHVEELEFAVSDLGTKDLFIGHEWLKFHNPNIDWKMSKILFDRCPNTCGYTTSLRELEEDDDAPEPPSINELEDGDRLFAFDTEAYIRKVSFATELAAKANKGKRTKTLEEMLPPHYLKYREVFEKTDFDTLPDRRPWDHAIELSPDFQPLDCKVYPLTSKEQEALEKFLTENLRTGRIRPSKSPMASPFFFVKKKDGELRPIQDYRKLNESTIKNRYPLPLIGELIDKLKGSEIFTKLDVRWGYNNIRMREGDEWKAAFRTNRGLFEPTVMFFGLTNSPATFQAMMDHLFKDLITAGNVMVYIDDIVIHTHNLDTHREVTEEVLRILRDNKLYIKPEKCEIEQREIEYLGIIVSKGRIRMDPVKTKAITEWPIPTKVKELQQFLGFCNFYRRFIRDYSRIAKPLTTLTGKVPWEWSNKQQIAFNELQRAVSNHPVLAIPIDNAPYRLEADSSDFAIGAVLSQKQDDKWHPIAYLSKSLNEAERNYEIYDKEMLAIMTALGEWRHYLLTNQVFEVWTDHQNLCYFQKPQKLNRRQARWITELQEYNFTLHHKPGKTNIKADILSRRADHNRGENDNEDITMLKSEWF